MFITKSPSWFISQRPLLDKFARKVVKALRNNKSVIVHGPCKCGKREMVTRIVQLMRGNILHIFITSLNVKSNMLQLEEIKDNVGRSDFFTCNIYKNTKQALSKLIDKLDKSKYDMIVVHFDESDYGTGDEMTFSEFYNRAFLGRKNLFFVFYSATNYEADSGTPSEFATRMYFDPGPSYNGMPAMINSGMLFEAEAFWNGEGFSNQGEKIISDWKKSSKTFGVLRFNSQMMRDRSLISLECENRGIKLVMSDERHIFGWECDYSNIDALRSKYDDNWVDLQKDARKHGKKILIGVRNGFSRSTECKFHDDWFFFHEYRVASSAAAIIQSAGRWAHFGELQQIRYYGDSKVIKAYVDDPRRLSTLTRKISPRVSRSKVSVKLVDTGIKLDKETLERKAIAHEKLKELGFGEFLRDGKTFGGQVVWTSKSLSENVAEAIATGEGIPHAMLAVADKPCQKYRGSWLKAQKKYDGQLAGKLFKKESVKEITHKTNHNSIFGEKE